MNIRSDRRQFLLGSVATAAASSQLRAAPGDEVRVAHIGIGARGTTLVRHVLAEERVRITAVCDIDPQARDKAQSAARRDNPRSYAEWKQLLDLKDVDAVVIATPCDLHAEMSAACLLAGKYVYCEKPLGVTPEQVDLAVKAARRSKAFLQIGQQLRYFATMKEAIRQIHEGLVGRQYIIKAQRHSGKSRPVPGKPERVRLPWYNDLKRSGDLIVENAVHNLDACNWIADSRPVSAYGHGGKYFPAPIPAGSVMMDGFSVEYIYENGMHVDYSQLSFHPRHLKELPNGMWYTIFGEKGSVFLTHSSATFYDLYGEAQPGDMLSDE
ncbi:MAG TPA: Gfo/Idh/MocA family oxidoreductase, partial [Terriglobales bacterium]